MMQLNSTLKIRDFIENKLEYPILLDNILNSEKWKGLRYTMNDWGNIFCDIKEKIPLRFGKICTASLNAPQWESDCLCNRLSFDEFLTWHNNSSNVCYSECGTKICSDKYWAYFDYFYMKNLKNKQLANELVAWEDFGFPELTSDDTTLWIGTKGANTPCHSDTYGCNIVCQMYGSKRWILFPREQSHFLYPTRIPYEESSIYSKIGFPFPNMELFPSAFKATPFIVTLEPGQCLLVPKHWWHYVECLDFSVSINTWISCASDSIDKLKEAFVMHFITSICQSITSTSVLMTVFNPNMLELATSTSSEQLNILLDQIKKFKETCPSLQCEKNDIPPLRNDNIAACAQPIKSFTFEYYLNLVKSEYCKDLVHNNSESPHKNNVDSDQTVLYSLINAVTDDRVISKIIEVMKENLENKM